MRKAGRGAARHERAARGLRAGRSALRRSTTIPDNVICLTVDVEWAHAEVLADLVRALDEHGLRATFFCTHAGIDVPGHERALHPNFRRDGDVLRALRDTLGHDYALLTDAEVHRSVLQATQAHCPEARGVRAHSLHYDTQLVALYSAAGLQYDSSYCATLVPGLRPFWKEHDLLECPLYYMDHLDLLTPRSGFEVTRLGLDTPGLKVFDFHPNIVYTNAPTGDFYTATKAVYHDPARLLALRSPGRGVRTLFLDLLDYITAHDYPTATLGQVNESWRVTL
jgi:hypothetical protein